MKQIKFALITLATFFLVVGSESGFSKKYETVWISPVGTVSNDGFTIAAFVLALSDESLPVKIAVTNLDTEESVLSWVDCDGTYNAPSLEILLPKPGTLCNLFDRKNLVIVAEFQNFGLYSSGDNLRVRVWTPSYKLSEPVTAE